MGKSVRSSSADSFASDWEDIARVKVEYAGTVRQVVFDSVAEVSWEVFTQKISEAYHLAADSNIGASYVDEDGDTIQVDSAAELRDLLKLSRVPKLSISAPIAASVTVPVSPETSANPEPIASTPVQLFRDISPSSTPVQNAQQLAEILSTIDDALALNSHQHPNLSDDDTSTSSTSSISEASSVVPPPRDQPKVSHNIPITVDYPNASEFDAESSISMHNIESVAASEYASTDAAPDASNLPENHQSPPETSSEEIPHSDRAHPGNIVIDMSEVIAIINNLVEQVTRDPEFMEKAMKTLHEFAESSKAQFEDLLRMFNEMLSNFQAPSSSSGETKRTRQFPPRYSVVFDCAVPENDSTNFKFDHPKGSTTNSKPFVIRFDGESRSLPQTPPEQPKPKSWGSQTIHLCTGITDECRHLHGPNSYTAAQAASNVAEQVRGQAESIAGQARVQAAQARMQASQVAAQARIQAQQAAAQARIQAQQARFAAAAAASTVQSHAINTASRVGEHVEIAVSAAKEAASAASSSGASVASDAHEHIVSAVRAAVGGISGVLRAVGSSSGLRGAATTNSASQSAVPPPSSPPGSAPRWIYTTCDVCGIKAFTGPRFKCKVCADYDLCGVCYYTLREGVLPENGLINGHELSHDCMRIDHPNESNRSQIDEQVDRVMEMGISVQSGRTHVEELVVHFGGDLDRVVEVLMLENSD
ncbi:hypothetical protein HK100_003843 [Physocladia obscura]|uniref:ZZ-type domain-containing protein n=1 Tax=Physocladia obscura TaxID=109957 RepID=A0AAD5STS7_9FUNG|nr:hypothetical protein HK100_003843 [Physocladia obscura]